MTHEFLTSVTKSGFIVRLPLERWSHIIESHDEMAGYIDLVIETVEEPDLLVKGWTEGL